MRKLRWSLAFLIAAAGVAAVVATHVDDKLRRCTVVETSGGEDSGQTTTTCAPVAPSDLLPIFLLSLILVAPDFASIGLPGGIELNRVQERVARQDSAIQQLQSNFLSAAANASSTSNQSMILPIFSDPAAVADLIKGLNQPVETATRVDVQPPPDVGQTPGES